MEDRKEYLHLKVSKELKERLKILANKKELTVSSYVRMILSNLKLEEE